MRAKIYLLGYDGTEYSRTVFHINRIAERVRLDLFIGKFVRIPAALLAESAISSIVDPYRGLQR